MRLTELLLLEMENAKFLEYPKETSDVPFKVKRADFISNIQKNLKAECWNKNKNAYLFDINHGQILLQRKTANGEVRWDIEIGKAKDEYSFTGEPVRGVYGENAKTLKLLLSTKKLTIEKAKKLFAKSAKKKK